MPFVPSTSLAEVVATCETLYARDGYVSWSEVGKIYGVTRAAIHSRLNRAVGKGDLAVEQMERWRSPTSKIALTRGNRKQREQEAKLTIQVTLLRENHAWMRHQCALRKANSGDIINGLITKARQAE